MQGHPDCSWASLRQPRLRACPLPHNIVWLEKLGYGLDGTVWKVEINGHAYALKVVNNPERNRKEKKKKGGWGMRDPLAYNIRGVYVL
ncbi:hypothetical protein V8C37DRAFT_388333 [Trichoderma ceciliae]